MSGGAITSLPVRERGLKFDDLVVYTCDRQVAPREGAWIEINRSVAAIIVLPGRSP